MRPQLVIAVDNHANAVRLGQELHGCTGIVVLELSADKLPTLPDLDAIFLTLPAAEQWGARPLVHKAQILRTQPTQETSPAGMPPYVIAGVAMAPDDPHDPVFELQLIVTSALEAVQAFNATHPEAIKVIGFWAENLLLGQLEPEQIGKTIRAAWEKTPSSMGS
jgi:hypothetical protein